MEAKEIPDQVITSIEEITLPTYVLLGENRNPVFHSQYGVAHIYPYTLQDQIATQPADIAYRALVLENRYLRVTVLPQLGGRVFSLFDKITEKEVFYKNPTVKFSPLAIRGAFFSGGLEFSFPVAHAPTTAESVNWDFQTHDDGSAAIIIGGLEHMGGMRWTIKLTLFPNRCALAQDVQLFNPTPIPGRYHYWTNASTHSDKQTEFIYPLQRVRSYEFAGTTSWPIARLDAVLAEPGLPGMEGVPMWPADRMHEPFNFRWEKNMLAQVSIFGRDVTWDFFGAWQHSTNTGYAHFARYQDVSGMKLWSWGQSEVGIVNQSALMDDGALYAETQCGAMETQLDFDLLLPGKSKIWREWWLPLRDLGGMTCASAALGARLHLAPHEDQQSVTLTVGICPAFTVSPANIELSIPGQVLLEQSTRITPEEPWLEEIQVEGSTLSSHPITLKVKDDQGQLLLDYTHDTGAFQDELLESTPSPPPESADDFYQQGLQHENYDNRAQALKSYRKAIFTSEEHGPSHFQLGLMLLRSADFDGAGHHLRWASDLGIKSADYYLGLLAWYLGDTDGADKHYRSVPDGDPLAPAALYGRVAVAFKDGDWKAAEELLHRTAADPDDYTSKQLLLGLASKRAGNLEAALDQLGELLQHDPLNLPALNELANLETGNQRPITEKLQRLLADDNQYILDLACFYLDLGLVEDAALVLKNGVEKWPYPPIFYLLANLPDLDQEPGTWRVRAQEEALDFVFPSRLWEVIALQKAIESNPDDLHAKYFLGNFYYSRQRYDEAMQLWEQALAGLDTFDILYRNLGLAYWQYKGDLPKAIEFFEAGLAINPDNQDLYLHLDDLYKTQEDNQQRASLLEKMELLNPIREDLRKRKLAIMIDLDRHEQALAIMNTEEFVPLEMDQSFHNTYVSALLKVARDHQDSGRLEEAIAAYRSALEFPGNHGVGRPITMGDAEILYKLGCTYEQLGNYRKAISAWQKAAAEHHKFGDDLYRYVQMSLDKIGRYSELGFEG